MTTLLVAATGGHLKQLFHLRPRLWDVEEPFSWVTFDKPQSRSLLEHEQVDFVSFIGSRDPLNAVRGLPEARAVLRRRGATAVVSTGSAIALPFFAAARAQRLECLYIESAARSLGPSLTGRMVSAIPGVRLFTQYPAWAHGRWSYRGSVFDRFVAGEPDPAPAVRRVVVTLGTLKYGFERLVRRLEAVIPADADVLWQVGATSVEGVRGRVVATLPERELSAAMAAADVVVGHSGVGSALGALENGRVPVLVPRRAAFGEHVDDHQAQIGTELAGRGLAVLAEADQLTLADLRAAAASVVVER